MISSVAVSVEHKNACRKIRKGRMDKKGEDDGKRFRKN
jgi:hypothetical protein